jgi:uncharacterized protein (TIGR00255 family)
MQSMTGYGSGRTTLGDGHIVLDLRAVNSRYLDVRVRLPSRVQNRTPTVERVIRNRLERGRIDVTARFEGQTLPQAELDVARARQVYRELGALRDALSPDEPLPLSVLSCVPDLFVTGGTIDENALDKALAQATEEACSAITAMRRAEGKALAEELTARLGDVAAQLQALRAELPRAVEARRTRLRDRLDALLRDVDVELQPSRLEQEVALLADRSDIAEEVVRLESHCAQMLALIDDSRKPVGKRIDFLLQEMAREANTIGSKVQDAAMSTLVIELRATLEQMREQAQNVL